MTDLRLYVLLAKSHADVNARVSRMVFFILRKVELEIDFMARNHVLLFFVKCLKEMSSMIMPGVAQFINLNV